MSMIDLAVVVAAGGSAAGFIGSWIISLVRPPAPDEPHDLIEAMKEHYKRKNQSDIVQGR